MKKRERPGAGDAEPQKKVEIELPLSSDITITNQALHIGHATTDDAPPDGQPWPPVLGDGWHLVHNANGRSTWRRITMRRD